MTHIWCNECHGCQHLSGAAGMYGLAPLVGISHVALPFEHRLHIVLHHVCHLLP